MTGKNKANKKTTHIQIHSPISSKFNYLDNVQKTSWKNLFVKVIESNIDTKASINTNHQDKSVIWGS